MGPGLARTRNRTEPPPAGLHSGDGWRILRGMGGPWVVVAGARPQFVKAAALLPALRARRETLLVHTGQHADPRMVEAHFAGLGLGEPDVRLRPAAPTRAGRLAEMTAGLAATFAELAPAHVIVLGDTDSTVAAALAAAWSGRPVAHVEAGARSGERALPEERNRILADELSDLLFCSTEGHAANLAGRPGVAVTGDVMVDVLTAHAAEIERRRGRGDYAVLTLHRAGAADDPAVVRAVLDAAASAGTRVVFPRHPRTAATEIPPGVELRPPLPYLDFLGLVAGARLVLTDSGGLQKEAYCLGVPCLTLRDATEWPETVAGGWNVLVGTDPARIRAAMEDPPGGGPRSAVYGDGRASVRIAERLDRARETSR